MSAVFIPVEGNIIINIILIFGTIILFSDLNSLLSQCRNLVKLSLENCKLNHACCKNIGLNTKLKVLNLACTSGLDRIGLKHILSLKK